MARYFSQSKIDEFKECFSFNARKNQISQVEELSLIMRSLGFSPTREETTKYLEKYKNEDSIINFALFLDILHEHCQTENNEKEIMQAFQAHDKNKTGTVPGNELRQILLNLGERLTRNEVDTMFREMNFPANGPIRYESLVKYLLTPIPDY
ncbi:CALM [Acanthosepion pharaonis]|uniref:CALM n=1 Tax=Acanthosepion pharaonis TaxID=158019 RepID=A0A812AME7_ACAPH|nr:CALM [Sepia pharaonis]